MGGMDLVKELETQGKAILAAKPGYKQAGLTAAKLFTFIYLYETVLPELNTAKRKLDAAHQAEDRLAFDAAMQEFKTIAHKLWTAKKELKARRKLNLFKIHKDLFDDAMQKIYFVEQAIERGELWSKRASMSPAKCKAAIETSLRMSAFWG